ncbi:urease accessory UreF family protein [Paludisphaera sp.]|uniref:urease accessory protein UreF n=1 Tax=Paludisphaera sp. TaxID=2017432 RepID=UPI00301D1D6B
MNLGLLQLADSALPISGYTHSWGLEAAIARGSVHDPETLERWTLHWLRESLGPFEGTLVVAARRATGAADVGELARLNEVVEATIAPPSTRRASREMGGQLLALGATWSWSAGPLRSLGLATGDAHEAGWHHPVAFGVLGAISGGTPEEVLAAYLHQAALGMIGAGVRAIPVGHTHGQQVLAYIHDELRSLIEDIRHREPETAGSGSPSHEILCDEQTRLYARMFRS